MSEWHPLSDIADEPATEAEKVFHALLWGRLHVSTADNKWVTDWKVLKAAWVRWTGSGVNGSAKYADNWYHGSDSGCRIDRVEATHWMPLPEAPDGVNKSGTNDRSTALDPDTADSAGARDEAK